MRSPAPELMTDLSGVTSRASESDIWTTGTIATGQSMQESRSLQFETRYDESRISSDEQMSMARRLLQRRGVRPERGALTREGSIGRMTAALRVSPTRTPKIWRKDDMDNFEGSPSRSELNLLPSITESDSNVVPSNLLKSASSTRRPV